MAQAECRCAFCPEAQPDGAAGAAAANTRAAAANAGAAPAATEAVAAAAAANAAAADDAARQSACDQRVADLIRRVDTLEQGMRGLRDELERGRACSSSAEAYTCKNTYYLLGASKPYEGERTSVDDAHEWVDTDPPRSGEHVRRSEDPVPYEMNDVPWGKWNY